MALPTWEEVLTRSRLQPFGAVASNPEEAKKAFDWLIENSYALEKWKKLSYDPEGKIKYNCEYIEC